MNLLQPWVLITAAAITVPLLLLLYFLKLRRREQTISSTLLWKRAVQDLQVNAPFQRLRKNLLLFLQLLVLLACAVALARPVVQSTISNEKSVVILIDRSGSMNTREGEQTRLEIAKDQAVRLVRTLNRTGSSWFSFSGPQDATRAMVIAFADRATIVSPFTTNTSDLIPLIEAIEPTDGPTHLREALELAEAYSMITRVEMRPNVDAPASRLVVMTDGNIADLDQIVLRSGSIEQIRIGQQRDNAGITAMRLQRNYERPEELSVFLQVQNFGPEAVTSDLSLYVGAGPAAMSLSSVQTVELGPARARSRPDAAGAEGEEAAGAAVPSPAEENESRDAVSLTFELTMPTSGLVEARLARGDALEFDNRAFAVVPAPRRLQVLLVSAGNFFLESALVGQPIEKLTYWTPQQYESKPAAELEVNGQCLFDVVIFDKHDTARLPAGNYLFIGCVPKVENVERGEELANHAVMWWDETHALLRNVAMEPIIAARGFELRLPQTAEKIAEGPRGPLLARYSRDGRQFLILTFAVEDTNWFLQSGFPIFAYNALRYLGSGGTIEEQASLAPGSSVRIPAPANVSSVRVVDPAGRTSEVPVGEDGVARFAGTNRAGVYQVQPGVEGRDLVAVNLEDPHESRITPTSMTVGGVNVAQGEAIRTSTPEVWRWFVGAALLILMIEWYIYNRRVMI